MKPINDMAEAEIRELIADHQEDIAELRRRLPENKHRTDDRPIAELDLTVRSYNNLLRYGIYTIAELYEQNEASLLALPNFGRTSLDDVRLALRRTDLPPLDIPNATTCQHCGGPL